MVERFEGWTTDDGGQFQLADYDVTMNEEGTVFGPVLSTDGLPWERIYWAPTSGMLRRRVKP